MAPATPLRYASRIGKKDCPVTASSVNRSMNVGEWATLLVLSLLWGGSFFFAGVAVKSLPPFTLVLLRVGLAAVILNVVVKALGMKMPRGADVWAALFAMGLLNNAVPFCLIVWGQGYIASGLAAILNATTPLWTVVVAHFLTPDEKMTGNRLAGVVIGFTGVVVMIGVDPLKGLGTDAVAQFAVLLAAVCYAFAGVYGRRFRRMGIAPMLTATGQVTASTFMMLPVALIIDRPWTLAMPGVTVWLAVVGGAALSTALGYILYFRILASAGATNLLLVTFLIPVSAIVLGSLVLAEHLALRHFVGMAFIGAGLAAIDGRLLRIGRPAEA
jgi:drug/metabolite transporter (DMT)-like permease